MRSLSRSAGIVMLLLGGWLSSPAWATDIVLNRFNSAAEADAWAFDWGAAPTVSIGFDATHDAAGSALSGALKIVVAYDGAITCDTGCNNRAFTRNLWPGMDLTDAGTLEMDLMVDPASPTRGGNDYGDLGVGTRDGDAWAYNGTDMPNLTTAGTWTHVSVSFTGMPNGPHSNVQGLTIQNWGGADLTGTMTLWIDNVVIKPKVGPSATRVIADFNSADEIAPWSYDSGCTSPPSPCQPVPTIEFDATEDALGDSNSGALRVSATFDKAAFDPTGWNQLLLNMYPFPGAPADIRDYNIFIARIKVDPASAVDAYGSHGAFAWVLRNNWGWQSFFGVNMPDANSTDPNVDANGWFNIEVPIGDPSAVGRDAMQALTLQVYAGGGYNFTGPLTFWVDHIVLGRTNACADPGNCESCFDGVDNNGNGLADCYDPDCAGIPHCTETACTDFVDNENDGLVDCADPDCATDPACQVNAIWADLDGDNDVDLADFGLFQRCFSGPVQLLVGCGGYDRDHNLRIDEYDMEAFASCFSGPGVAATNCP